MKCFTPKIVLWLIVLSIGSIIGLLGLSAVNEIFGEKTTLETFPGTKSVCARMQYNYALKVTQCVEYKNVPATCEKVEHKGPIFDTFINTTCE